MPSRAPGMVLVSLLDMSNKEELRLRYEAAKKDLEARIAEKKSEGEQSKNRETEELEARLEDLQRSARDAWDDASEVAAKKLNQLIDRVEGRA